MTDGPNGQAQGWPVDARIIMAGMFLAAMIPLLVTPVLPLIDFYNHLSRFYVLAHVGSNRLLQNYYQADWALLPDIGVDAIASLLLRFVPPLIGGHIIIVGILSVLYSGVLYFHRVLTGQRSLLVAALLLPLLYSYILNWGFANFLLGLGMAFWAAGWWLAHRNRPLLAMPISCLIAILIYLTHGVAFALYGVLTVSLEVGIFVNAPVRKSRDLIKALLLLATQAVIPVIWFISWQKGLTDGQVLSGQSGFSPRLFSTGLTIGPEHSGLRRLSTILRVEEGPSFWFDIVTLFIQVTIAGFLIWCRQISVVRTAWISVAVAFLLILLTPQKMFGVDYIADRIPLFAACCLLGSISLSSLHGNRGGRMAVGVLVAVVFARLLTIAIDWHGYSATYREFQSIAAKIPPGSLTMGVAVGAGRHETDVPRCEMYGPLLIAQFGQIGPSFSFKGQHPLLFKGRLGQAVDILERTPVTATEDVSDYNAYIMAVARAGMDYILVCNAQLLKGGNSPNLIPIDRTPNFSLLKVMKP